MKKEYQNVQMEFLAPLGFGNSWVLVVTEAFGKANGIGTLSQASKYQNGWRMATNVEFLNRSDGMARLQTSYNLSWGAAPRSVDRKSAYQQLSQQQVNIVAGSATDAALLSGNYRVLQDDKLAFGAYDEGIVVRSEKLLEYPGMRQALEELSGKLSLETVRRLSAGVDGEQRSISKVASEFLQKL